MRAESLILALWLALPSTGCAGFGAFLESGGKALAPESQGGGGGAATVAGLLPEPWRTPAQVALGALGVAGVALGRRLQRRGEAFDVLVEGIGQAPDDARRKVTDEIQRRARRRGVNDVIERRIQG